VLTSGVDCRLSGYIKGLTRSGNLVYETLAPASVRPRSHAHSANLLEGSLGAQILRTNKKDDPVHESEGVLQHELFHVAVVGAAPMGPGEECPTDFDLAPFFVVSVESRRPDDPAISGIKGD